MLLEISSQLSNVRLFHKALQCLAKTSGAVQFIATPHEVRRQNAPKTKKTPQINSTFLADGCDSAR